MLQNHMSFINGAIAGAGIMLSIMSIAFLQMTGSLEGKMGFTTTEIRVAIFLGFLVFIISLLYEVYRKKSTNVNDTESFKQSLNQKDALDE